MSETKLPIGMELWIARDKNGRLALYRNKPQKCEFKNIGIYVDMELPFPVSFIIDKEAFPEVTWENSPKKVRIELMEDVAKSDIKGKPKAE